MDIEALAEKRAAAATKAGRDPKPWLDPDRDFDKESREELADAINYINWWLFQIPDEKLTDSIGSHLEEAIILITRANMHLDFAAKKLEG